jgi:hypothetical protein
VVGTQAHPELVGVAESGDRLLLTRELGGELLVVVGGPAVEGQLVPARGDLEERLLGQGVLGVVLDQLLAGVDRAADQVSVLEAQPAL